MKPNIPKGTRDFNIYEVSCRNFIKKILEESFQKFGFGPIETPSFENIETLTNKYGEEGDRLIFKILNSGEKIKKANIQAFKQNDFVGFINSISNKALRYDLTVPFARYVAKNQNDITFPFKRYQIQPVWRADRPQNGRFQEFVQCDADSIGSNSIWQEIELIQLFDHVFTNLGLKDIVVNINHRKVLFGVAKNLGFKDNFIDFTVSLDKIDKIGKVGVLKELKLKGISIDGIKFLEGFFEIDGENILKLKTISNYLNNESKKNSGVEELNYFFQVMEKITLKSIKINFDITLARGLSYYTGFIFEAISIKNISLGSIGGGGRYDDLTGVFGLKNVSGVGISFGFERIYMILKELNLFPEISENNTQILFANFGEDFSILCNKCLFELRNQGIRAEYYPDSVKINKQISYANKKRIDFIVFIGSNEIKSKSFILKNMKNGNQNQYSINDLVSIIIKESS